MAYDEGHLRSVIELATRARDHGNHPFAALLVDASGTVLLEAENTVLTTGDITGHAELNLVREATQRFDTRFLGDCTLYASTEPCAMCAGAIYWSGIGAVVFALSSATFGTIVPDDTGHWTLDLSCREVFARGPRPVAVDGPLLEAEAGSVHEGFWR